MACHRHYISCALSLLAVCTVAVASGSTKKPAPPVRKPLPTLSAQEIFKRVSPSVMVVESLDAKGKITEFGSGVVIAPGHVITNRHVIEDGVSFRVVHNDNKWPAKLIKEVIGILVSLVALLWAAGKIHGRRRLPERLVATLRLAIAVALLGTIVYGIGYVLWSPYRTLRLISDFSQWAVIAILLAGTPIAFRVLMNRRKKTALKLALVLAFIILIWLLRTWPAHPFRHSQTRLTAEESAAVQTMLHPKVLQRLRARDVEESGPDMKSTYSGFVGDGRTFAATQNSDEGSCMVTTPEQAQWERREFHVKGTVEPIFLIQYDDGRGGSFWEITQNTRAGDVNFIPPSAKEPVVEETCGVSVIFH